MHRLNVSAALLASAALLLVCPIAAAAPLGPLPHGDVVSVGPLPAAAVVPGAVDSKRILYRTTGIGREWGLSSGAVYFPPGRPPAGGWPILAWAHGTVGIADQCAYSVAGPVERTRDWTYLSTWLAQGYAIVASDYAGLGTPGPHPYLNGVIEAHNVVDSVKAATQAFPRALARKWMVIGQSQGAAAALVTARYATWFAPELDYRGAVATGVPSHLEDLLPLAGPGVPPLPPTVTTYLLYLLSGLRTSYPNAHLDSYLTPLGKRWVDASEQLCYLELKERVTQHRVHIGAVLARPLSAIPGVRQLLASYAGIPESGYSRPLFIGQGLTDTDVVTPATLTTVAAITANNQPLTFRAYPTDHNGTMRASLADSIPFVRGLFT